MCGLLGIVSAVGTRLGIDDTQIVGARDRLAHRGPDSAGLARPAPHVVLTHRRLAIIDPSPRGHQPMATPSGSHWLVYNGMLYNDADVRAELVDHPFRSTCDTETVLAALSAWGGGGLPRLRGMFALACFDARAQTLTLARDPMGIKPLYWTRATTGGVPCVAFASEIPALLALPGVACEPDLATVSAYLTTIRTTLDERTMYAGVRTVRPGEVIEFDLSREGMPTRTRSSWPGPVELTGDVTSAVRTAVEEANRLHARADVSVCGLLSGGLDSAITTLLAQRHVADLRTYCAGDPDAAPVAGVPQGEDFRFARLVAERLGMRHTEVPVRREDFLRDWPAMVARLGVPMSTPNEVAIHAVARVLAGDAHKVVISGEGADELFAGYAGPMAAAAAHVASGNADPGMFQLESNAWLAPTLKPAVLRPEAWREVEGDAALHTAYRGVWDTLSADDPRADPLELHLRFHRRINLAGLLARLDTATMLASVEGRTPFADAHLARVAEAVPMREKYLPGELPGMKRVLRRAFVDRLPAEVVQRPKASFPLPFQHWMDGHAESLRSSALIDRLFAPEAVAAVAGDPAGHWALAWPMLNLALWDRSLCEGSFGA